MEEGEREGERGWMRKGGRKVMDEGGRGESKGGRLGGRSSINHSCDWTRGSEGLERMISLKAHSREAHSREALL